MDEITVTIFFKDHNMQPLKIKKRANSDKFINILKERPYMLVQLESSGTRVPLYTIAEDAVEYVDWGTNDAVF